MKDKDKVIIHHTGSPRDTTTVEMVNEWHRDRGFGLSERGYYVGYHYLITFDGKITKTRNNLEDGCHCNSFDWGTFTSFNKVSLGICLTGNFETEYPTEEQLKSLRYLIEAICPKKILGHRDVKNTACPGENLYKKLVEIRVKL